MTRKLPFYIRRHNTVILPTRQTVHLGGVCGVVSLPTRIIPQSLIKRRPFFSVRLPIHTSSVVNARPIMMIENHRCDTWITSLYQKTQHSDNVHSKTLYRQPVLRTMHMKIDSERGFYRCIGSYVFVTGYSTGGVNQPFNLWSAHDWQAWASYDTIHTSSVVNARPIMMIENHRCDTWITSLYQKTQPSFAPCYADENRFWKRFLTNLTE